LQAGNPRRRVRLPVEIDDGIPGVATALDVTGCSVVLRTASLEESVHHLRFDLDASCSLTIPAVATACSGTEPGHLVARRTVQFHFVLDAGEVEQAVAILLHSLGQPGGGH
jgi:hypothetical protein